jgi:hypothetical protein
MSRIAVALAAILETKYGSRSNETKSCLFATHSPGNNFQTLCQRVTNHLTFQISGFLEASQYVEGHGKLGTSVTLKDGLFLQLKHNIVTLDTNSLEQSPS